MLIHLPQPINYILWKLTKSGYDVFVVGGAVRDVLLDRKVNDWDFTTNATPEHIQAVFPDSFYDNQFGTVGIAYEHLVELMVKDAWHVEDEISEDQEWQSQVFEITTYRSESGYSDSRRPDKVEWGTSLEDDLKRRDFTINALALGFNHILKEEALVKTQAIFELDARIIDLYGGQEDLHNKLIRAVGDPDERFKEDALRMMRAIRFGAQLGFLIEENTLSSIKNNAQRINHISMERISEELLKILASAYPADGIALLHSSGLLGHIIPELTNTQGIEQGGHHIYDVWKHSLESLRLCPSPDPIVRLAALLHDIGKPVTARPGGPRGVTFHGHEVVGARMSRLIGDRLRLSKKQIEKLFMLVRWHMFHYQENMTDAAIRRFIRRVGVENINDMIMLRIGDRLGSGSKATSWRLRELQRRIGEQLYQPLSVKDLKVDGHDVMEILDIPPGKHIGVILDALFEEILDNPEKNNRDYLVERIKELG